MDFYMITFQKPTLRDRPSLAPYFSYSAARSNDNTVGGTILWREYFRMEYAVWRETLLFRMRYYDGEPGFLVPVGRDAEGALDQIEAWCMANRQPMRFVLVTAPDVERLSRRWGTAVSQAFDFSDYLYDAEELRTLRGHRFNGQRNHVNYFKRAFPDWRYEPLTDANRGEVFDFYSSSRLIDAKDTPFYRAEQSVAFDALERTEEYGFFGGAIRAGGRIVSFAIGEELGDTLFVHVEKGDAAVRGAYPMIVSEFPRHASLSIRYVNREDDAGDPGLRTSKQSYHPCAMLEKYTVLCTPSSPRQEMDQK